MTSENSNHNDSEIAAIKGQLFALLIALIVISGTLTVYLYRQASMAGKDEDQLSFLVSQNEAALGNFITKLVAYGEKHPDFLPVLKKYGIAPVPGVPANAPVGTVPAAPKK